LNFNINTFVHASDSDSLELFQHKMYQNRYTTKNAWWRAERLPETCIVVIAIKLEFSAPLGFIHKEYFTYVYGIILYIFCSMWNFETNFFVLRDFKASGKFRLQRREWQLRL